MRQIHHHGREESALGQPQQEADDIELGRVVDEACEPGQQTPGDHDGGDPLARAPRLGQDRAGNLQQAISEEKYSRAEAEYLVGEFELARHLQPGEADIHAIEVGGDVQQKKKRNQPSRDFSGHAGGDGIDRYRHPRLQVYIKLDRAISFR